MFTGIIRGTGTVVSSHSSVGGKLITLNAGKELASKLEKGITSVAVNGSCHTVTELDPARGHFTVYSSFETLERTTMGLLKTGSLVNLELPVTPQTFLDGHIVQGHVDGMGEVSSMRRKGEAWLARYNCGHDIMAWLVEKDSIAVDGVSLTIYNIDETGFSVAMIPETAAKTTLGGKKSGDRVNLEVNIMAKYARRFLTGRSDRWQDIFKEK